MSVEHGAKLKLGDKGNVVRDVQNMLTAGGEYVTADGHLGPVTWDALNRFAMAHGLRWDKNTAKTIGDELARTLFLNREAVADGVVQYVPSSMQQELNGKVVSVPFYNLLRQQAQPIPRSRVVRNVTVMRGSGEITGVTLHQMACTYGVSAQQVKAAGGNKSMARANRMMNIPAHACAMSTELGVVVHSPLAAFLHHAHAFNDDTLGLEVEGLYAGVKDVRSTMWNADEVAYLSNTAILSARAALKYLVEEGRDLGMPIQWLYAHRQTYGDKTGDPGSEIWQYVGLDYGVKVLGLKVRNDHTRRDGNPIPKDWDPDATAPYRPKKKK